MCIQFKIDGAQNSSRMFMCIEFVIQVLKQKNAHLSCPVGMVIAGIQYTNKIRAFQFSVIQMQSIDYSGKKHGTQTQTFGPDIFGWGGGLPHEEVGAKKFGMSLEAREIKLFFGGMGAPEKLRK